MPASLIYDFDNANNIISSSGNGLEDRRAFELALELSLLGLGNDSNENSNSIFTSSNTPDLTNPSLSGNSLGNPFDNEARLATKRSQNTTECVPVPSSEHVAEIVGRQGCKIKALRAKTNTYIKTPVRGEEPVFVVTGRKEDVCAAKREIVSAAEHFSQIRAQRKNNPGSVGPAPNAHLPGHITIQVRVPYRVVGLVVGPKGATIKRIQQQTNTYIITPSREKDPVFEVTGLPDDVETARKEIEAHIAIRTGGIIDSTTGSVGTPEESTSDFSNSPLLSSLDNPFSSMANSYNNSSLYKSSSDAFSTFTSTFTSSNANPSFSQNTVSNSMLSNTDNFNFGSNKLNDIYSLFSSNGLSFSNGSGSNSGKNTSTGSYDTDEGIGNSPTFDILAATNTNHSVWPDFTNSNFALNNMSSGPLSSNNTNDNNSNIGLEYHRRSSSLESNINSANSSSASSSCVSISAPTTASMI